MANKKQADEGDATVDTSEIIGFGQLGKLSILTQQIMKQRGWSYRQAQIATGVSFNAVERMAKGVMVETDTIVSFARAIAPEGKEITTVIEWLEAGGKSEMAEMLETAMLKPDTEVVRQRNSFEDLYLSADKTHRELAKQVLQAGSARRYRRPAARVALSTH